MGDRRIARDELFGLIVDQIRTEYEAYGPYRGPSPQVLAARVMELFPDVAEWYSSDRTRRRVAAWTVERPVEGATQ